VDFGGPLPRELQNYTVFTAGTAAGSKQPEAVKAFIKFLKSPAAAAAMKEKGMRAG
jgi:molybdate transport system substrate-binding protein